MWDKLLEVLAGQYPAGVLAVVMAAIVYRHQRKTHELHVASLERRFDQQSRAETSSNDRSVAVLQEMIRVLQLERDSLRKERNSLRRELGKPVDEG